MSRVLVTGSTGFIGRHLVQELRAQSVETVELRGDVRLPETWAGVLDVTVVFHLAAATQERFQADPVGAFSTNVGGTLLALDACRRLQARMVLASTSGVYAAHEAAALSEESPLDPQTPYARSKMMAEMLCRSYAEVHGVSCTVFRIFNVYGEGQSASFLIPYLVDSIIGDRVCLLRHPDSRRDFVHVSDTVRGLIGGASCDDPFSLMNLGSGRAHSVVGVLEQIGRIAGRPARWERGDGDRNTIRLSCADATRARRSMGWTCRVSLEQGLRGMVQAHVQEDAA